MKIKLALDVEDYLFYHLYRASQSPTLKKRRLRNWILVPAVYFISGVLLLLLKGSEMISMIFFVTGALWVFLYPLYSKWAIPRYMRRQIAEKYSGIIGKEGSIEIRDQKEIKDQKIRLSGNGQSEEIKISDLTNILEFPGYYIIELTNGPGLILPKNKIPEEKINDLIEKISGQSGIAINNRLRWDWK
ncbi:MAG: YcxB family protein [Spirochaetia bacterium]|nr:YcxB family protein [Spirochaetia bacterium]